MLVRVRYRGVFLVQLGPLHQTSDDRAVESDTAEDPRSFREGVRRVDLAPLRREPQGAGRHTGDGRRLT